MIWRQKRKVKALKIRKMLRHGVRICKVGLQPCPLAHSSAASVCWSDAVLRFFNPARKATVARLKQSLLPPIVAVATSERLLRCCPPQDANTVPSTLPPKT